MIRGSVLVTSTNPESTFGHVDTPLPINDLSSFTFPEGIVLKYEYDDKGIPTVHLTIPPRAHVGMILLDGKVMKLTPFHQEA
jgi:hypothetical protein